MAVTIKKRGDQEASPRVVTGFYSLDWALSSRMGNFGFPVRSIVEITGAQGVGKSTLAFSLAGIIANKLGNGFTLVDFERQNEETVSSCLSLSGFSGEVDWVQYYEDKKGDITPEKILDISTQKCRQEEPDVVVVDSLGGFSPSVIHEGELGAANMGRKAKVLSDWFTRTLRPLIQNPKPSCVLFTNHQHPRFDVMKKNPNMPTPTQSSGGVGVGYYATQSFDIRRLYGYDYTFDAGYVIEGRINKNRDGWGKDKKSVFYAYIHTGEGLNRNLSAVIDCTMVGIAKSTASTVKEGSKITMDGRDFGKFRDMVENRFDPELFKPFHAALAQQSGGIQEMSSEIGE